MIIIMIRCKMLEARGALIKQRSVPSERRRARAAALVRQMSRVSAGSELPPVTPPPRRRIRVTAGTMTLSRKLSRRLDISFDKLDISAFPFQFLNTTVSC